MIPNSIKFCDKCSLSIFNGFVPVSGDGNGSDIMIIGETPGATEVRKGIPFVGKSGKLLRKILNNNHLLDKTYMTNAVKCRPPQSRTPRDVERTACSVHLLKELSVLKPKIVILLGLTAIRSFYPNEQYVKNKLYTANPFGKLIIFCTYHPSYILQNKDELKTYEQFFDKVSLVYSKLNPYYSKPIKR